MAAFAAPGISTRLWTCSSNSRMMLFRTLTQWNKKIAIEAGAVKEFYCTPDAIDDVMTLPERLPGIYRRLTT